MTLEVPAITETSIGVTLQVKVKPRSKKSCIAAIRNGCIILAIQAPPVDEKANIACIKFFASFLGLHVSSCELISGRHARQKCIRIHGISKDNFLNMWNNALKRSKKNDCT